MDLDTVDDDTLDQLADRLAERLDPGAYGDRVVLSRRQLVGVATGVLGTGTLLSLGVDPAAAQAAGSVGTSSDPVDVFAYDLDVQNGVTSSLAMNGNDITNAGSVSTEDLVFESILDGSTITLTTANEDGTHTSSTAIQFTDSVGTSAKTIYNRHNTDAAFDLIVLARTASSIYALDQVSWTVSGGVSQDNIATRGSPPGRSYSVVNSSELQLSLASGTANVAASGRGLGVPSP